MKDKSKAKNQTLIFRVPRAAVESLDALAKLTGVNRSEALRRLIPDLTANRIQSTGKPTTPLC